MPESERILLSMATFVCLLFVSSFRDSGPKVVTPNRIEPPPVPVSVTDRPGRVVATVENDEGAPVAGASVRVLLLADDRAYLAGAARTDAGGRAELGSLPRGETWILAEGEGFARASTRLVIGEPPRDVKMRLRQASVLRVLVVDDGGAPVERAWVEARTGDPLPFVTQSDATGHASLVRLGPPPWNVRIQATGYELVAQVVSKVGTEALKIVVRRLGSLDVATVDGEGKPVGNATVLVAGSGLWPARKIESNADGHAQVSDLPRGIYDLRAARGDRVSPAEMGLALGRGENKSLTLVLSEGRRIAVRVTDGDEEGAAVVAAASVVLVEGGLSSFPLEATTDSHGAASLGPIAPGEAYLSARADGFVSRTGVPVPPGASPTVRIGLVRGGTLRGDVVDARGYPVDGATVDVVGTTPTGEPIDESPERMAFRAAHFSWALGGPRQLVPAGALGVMPGPLPPVPHGAALPTGLLRPNGNKPPPEPWVTRDDGTFLAFPIPPGRVRAIVRHPSYIEGISAPTSLSPGAEARVHVVLRGGGTLEGRVIDDRGAPVAGAHVDMASAQGALERTTRTADDGTFAFAAVPAEVVVSVGRPDAADEVALRTNVSIKEAERKEIELVLPAAREAMTVEVTDERGTPLDGAQVSVLSLATDSPLRRTLFTGRDGRAVFKDAVGLPVRLSITRRGRAPENRDVDPAPSELRVELGGGVHVAGAITTRRGRAPLEGAEVTLYAVEGPRRARTDRAGNYSFDDVSPGSARLVASHAGYAKAEQEVRIERLPHADRDLSLEPIDLEEGGSIEGEVVDSHGDPIAGARVGEGSIPAYLPAGKLPSGLVVTDRRGQFKIEDLHGGDIVLEAFSPDAGRGRVSVHVSSGRSTRGVRITIAAASDETASEPTAAGGVAISFDETLPPSSGVAVAAVVEGSEAERAGVQPGDRILTIDGQPIASVEEAKARLFGSIGDDLVLEVSRAGARRKLRVARERVHR